MSNELSGLERTASEKAEWLTQLDAYGLEVVERWPAHVAVNGGEPLRWKGGDPVRAMWTEEWLVGKLKARRSRELWWTRGIAIVAIVVSLLALCVAIYTATHPTPVVVQLPK